jgi:uncharacterized Zn finger protein
VTGEGAEVKGRRLLTEGRLTVTTLGLASLVLAECKGDSGAVYKLGYDPRFKDWSCSCPALGKRCSHLVALKLVVAV